MYLTTAMLNLQNVLSAAAAVVLPKCCALPNLVRETLHEDGRGMGPKLLAPPCRLRQNKYAQPPNAAR